MRKRKPWKPLCYLHRHHMDLFVLHTERHRGYSEDHSAVPLRIICYKYSRKFGTTYGEPPFLIKTFRGEWNISE